MSGDDLLLVGRVARAHGNKGQVIVNPETDFPEQRFRRGQVLLVGPEQATVPRGILEVRFQQGRPIIALDGIESMNDAEALAGAGLWVEAGGVEPLPDNTFYRHDLVGCAVVDRSGAPVGTVTAVEGPMERSQLVVQGPRGEVLIPLAAGIVEVELAAKRVVVTPPDGLLELNETSSRPPERARTERSERRGASGAPASAGRVEWRRPATARSRRSARENRAREGGK